MTKSFSADMNAMSRFYDKRQRGGSPGLVVSRPTSLPLVPGRAALQAMRGVPRENGW